MAHPEYLPHHSLEDKKLISDAKWWQKEIKRRSSSHLDKLIYVLIGLLLCILVFAGYVYVCLPQGGKIWHFELTEIQARLVTYLVTIFSIIGITFSTIWKFYNPSFKQYLYAALDIVSEAKWINSESKAQMQESINRKLSCCTKPNPIRKECEEALKECCEEIARVS